MTIKYISPCNVSSECLHMLGHGKQIIKKGKDKLLLLISTSTETVPNMLFSGILIGNKMHAH